jgi:hypothetical protein
MRCPEAVVVVISFPSAFLWCRLVFAGMLLSGWQIARYVTNKRKPAARRMTNTVASSMVPPYGPFENANHLRLIATDRPALSLGKVSYRLKSMYSLSFATYFLRIGMISLSVLTEKRPTSDTVAISFNVEAVHVFEKDSGARVCRERDCGTAGS